VRKAGLPPSAPRGSSEAPVPRSVDRAAKPPRPSWASTVFARPLGFRIADSYLVLAAATAVELVVVAALAWHDFAGPYEVGRSSRALLPIAMAGVAPFAWLAAVLVELVRASDKRPARVASALAGALFMGVVGYGVANGRHFEGGLRVPFAAALALGGFAAAFALAPRISRLLAPATTSDRVRVIGTVTATALVLEVGNQLILPRLYPVFHHGLSLLTLLVVPAVTVCWLDTAPRRRVTRWLAAARVAVALVLFAGAAAGAQDAAKTLSVADNIRLVFLTHAPVLSHAVELAARLAPPPPIDEEGAPEVTSGPRTLDLSHRDIVLVTIDALRADHVGAYGYRRSITPNIDRLAGEGAVFEAAYTPTPHTSYAVTSLMTGKYMRPLLLQNLGDDSDTFALYLRRYGYRTAAFYPPAVFFIDGERFAPFRDRALDFEYRKVEFAPAATRATQVRGYLERVPKERNVFLWVHLFEPHEPYEAHPEHPLGDRDEDRYDAEIASADAGLGAIVDTVRAKRPSAVVIVAADHGEEFSDHGGRYHGTTVFEEQVRVPLVISAPGLVKPNRIREPVQLVDLLPTVLSALSVPRPARVRGADLGPLLVGSADAAWAPKTFAFAETETQTLLARDAYRLVCARKIGACSLYDVAKDPHELVDVAPDMQGLVGTLRTELRAVEASHGRFELRGLRAEGKGWPEALRRGIAGDADSVTDVAALLDDADVTVRRKAAEVLFELRRTDGAEPLRLALVRDEDETVRKWSSLALTRLGEGAPRVRELLDDPEPAFRHLSALALAESGDAHGEGTLVAWLRASFPPESKPSEKVIPTDAMPFERAREIVEALGKLRSKEAVPALIDALSDVRLRPYVIDALAQIGDASARPALARRLAVERYQNARLALAKALVSLGAGAEIHDAFTRFLGVPDPLPDGLALALKGDFLDVVAGLKQRTRTKLVRDAKQGVAVGIVIPVGGNGKGVRVLCRARALDGRAGEIHIGPQAHNVRDTKERSDPAMDADRSVTLTIPAGSRDIEAFATLPLDLHGGDYSELVFHTTQNVELSACGLVPLSDELPPPAPEPWTPSPGEADEGSVEAVDGGSSP